MQNIDFEKKNGFNIRPLKIFKIEQNSTPGCIRKMSRDAQIMTILVSTLYVRIDIVTNT